MAKGPGPADTSLVDLLLPPGPAAEQAARAATLPSWELSRRQRCDLELLTTGGFSPLDGFQGQEDYESVTQTMRLVDGTLWPMPITLDVPEHVLQAASAKGALVLRSKGTALAVMDVESSWRPDRRAEAHAVLGSTDVLHPGVDHLLNHTHDWYVAGPLHVLRAPVHDTFQDLRRTPRQVRSAIAAAGWTRVVAFQTRNPMHRAHQELTLRASRDLDARLLLHPVVGITKPGDVPAEVRVRCYRALLATYPPGTALLALLPLAMRMAGPREALWHALIRQNHGATHFIVGRDHAGPGNDARGRPFYDPYAAQDLVERHRDELHISPVPFRKMVYVEPLGRYLADDEVPPGHRQLVLSGTEQRRRLAAGEELPPWFTPPEVAAELRRDAPVQR